MKKRVKKMRKKDTQLHGNRDEKFNEWRKQNEQLKKYNLDEAISDEDDENLDSVEVEVFRVSKYGNQLEKQKVYIEAEAMSEEQAKNVGIVQGQEL